MNPELLYSKRGYKRKMRKAPRFLANALVYLDNKFESKNMIHLLNLSEHGLCIMSENYLGDEPNSTHLLTVVPEEESGIEEFQLQVRSRWIKLNKSRTESGFVIVVSFNEEEFKSYLEYLANKQCIYSERDKSPFIFRTSRLAV